MSTEFHYKIKRLEGFIAGGLWDRAGEELQSAYVLQPQNPYLAAYSQRLASLAASSAPGGTNLPTPASGRSE
jgi:hypothetical protein